MTTGDSLGFVTVDIVKDGDFNSKEGVFSQRDV